jgi:hypothetical protein
VGRGLRSPALAVLLIAPFVGETFSTASSPLQLVMPWSVPLVVGMYGCGVLVCHEVAIRFGFGWSGLALLGVAYAVYEEGLIDRFWWDPAFWEEAGVGDYSVVGGLNVLLAAHLTIFHAAISVITSILIVEWLFPGHRDRPWVGRRGLVLATLALTVVVPIFSLQFYVPSVAAFVFSASLMLVAIAAAFAVPQGAAQPNRPVRRRRRGLAWVALLATSSHFVLTYAVPHLGLPWPVGVVIALAPVGLGAAVVRTRSSTGIHGDDGLRVVCGMTSFFLALGFIIGLGGRYDLTLGAVLAAAALRWMVNSTRPVADTAPDRSASPSPHGP